MQYKGTVQIISTVCGEVESEGQAKLCNIASKY